MNTGAPSRAFVTLILLTALSARAAAAQFDEDLQAASQAVQASDEQRNQLVNEGKVEQANAVLLNAFPEKTRTAAQAFVIGNSLYEIDRAASYKLHKRAAELAPNEGGVAFEWAMEQHRAGEWAGALASYQKVSAARPGSAYPYALQADCLLHLGRIDEAAAEWAKSEASLGGTVEQMENLVCAIKREPMPHARRAELLKKATQQKDGQAALDLLALDCAFPLDWWNVQAKDSFLDHDVPAVLAALNLPKGDPRRRAIECGKAIAAIKADDAEAVKQALTASAFLLDANHSLPPHGGIARILLQKAMRLKLVSEAELHDTFAPLVLKQARAAAKDPVWWELACLCSAQQPDPDAQVKLEREAWKATADARFAWPVLAIRQSKGDLPWGDPELDAAIKQFPEEGPVLHVAVEQSEKTGKLTKELLAQAAKAEFKHFSSFTAPFTVVNRPRSDYLRQYFAKLSQMAGDGGKKEPLPF